MWLALGLVVRATYAGRVLPNVSVGGVELGGTDADEARKRIATLRVDRRRATVTAGGRRFTVRAGDAGLQVDVAASVVRARNSGREGPLSGLFTALPVLVAGAELDPTYEVDERALNRMVAGIAGRVDRRAFLGDLDVDPSGGTVRVVPARPGSRLERDGAAERIVRALQDGRRTVDLPLRRVPAPSRASIERVAASARSYLSRPLRLEGAGGATKLGRAELAPLLTVGRGKREAPDRVELSVRRRALTELVDKLVAARTRAPRDAAITALDAPPVVDEKGDLAWRPRRADVTLRRGRRGLSLDRGRATDVITSAIRRGAHRAAIPVEVTQPRVSTAAASRVRRLIGTFTTHYSCCAPRVTNIRRIARAVDGTVIGPGAQFSLNGVAGERTRAKGYVEAPYIADGKLVPSVGGGVSQFATTMYNAAFFAGLRLDAHQPHSFYIDRYPAGREATVDYATIDLTWTNDTQAPVVVRASSTPTSVTVALYGDNGGRRVRASSGQREPVPGRDFAVRVTRLIRYADGRVARQSYATTYDRPPAPE